MGSEGSYLCLQVQSDNASAPAGSTLVATRQTSDHVITATLTQPSLARTSDAAHRHTPVCWHVPLLQPRAHMQHDMLAASAGDALEDDWGLEASDMDASEGDGEDGEDTGEDSDAGDPPKRMKGSTLEQRQQARAAGSHPLQASFREAAASLLAKHGIQVRTWLQT